MYWGSFARGLQFTAHHHLAPKLRLSGALPLLPLSAYMYERNSFTYILYAGDHIYNRRVYRALCEGIYPHTVHDIHASQVTICSHNTENVLYSLYVSTFNQVCNF